jgi:hypothetical protein
MSSFSWFGQFFKSQDSKIHTLGGACHRYKKERRLKKIPATSKNVEGAGLDSRCQLAAATEHGSSDQGQTQETCRRWFGNSSCLESRRHNEIANQLRAISRGLP